MNNFLENIRQKPESHKRSVALGMSLVLTFLIALSWAGQRGFIGGGESRVAEAPKKESFRQSAAVSNSITPIESSKQSFLSGMEGIKKTYQSFKDSLSDVLVPFMSGIEVYEKK